MSAGKAYTEPSLDRDEAESASEETDCDISLWRSVAGDESLVCGAVPRTLDDERLSDTTCPCGMTTTSDLYVRLSGLLTHTPAHTQASTATVLQAALCLLPICLSVHLSIHLSCTSA